jgi:HEAT repeat protein
MIDLKEYARRIAGDDETERIYAAEDIGDAGSPEGATLLLQRLPGESSRAVRGAIFGALRRIRSATVVDGAVGLLSSEDPFLRNEAVDLLRSRGEGVVEPLTKAFVEGGNDQKKFVMDVLSGLDSRDSSKLYELALEARDLNVVITAVENLGNARRTEFRGRIESLVAAHAHPMLLAACIEALTKIGDAGSLEIVRACLCGAQGIPAWIGGAYVKLAGATGDPSVCSELAGLALGGDLCEDAVEALAMLRQRYPDINLPSELARPLQRIAGRSPSPLLAAEAVRLLERVPPTEDILKFLREMAASPEECVRAAALQCLRNEIFSPSSVSSGGDRAGRKAALGAHPASGEGNCD